MNGLRVVQLKLDLTGYLWDNFFSEFPFLGVTKNIFFNDYVKSKGNYVGNVSYYLCTYLEFFILDTLDSLVPDFLKVIFLLCVNFNICSQNCSEKEMLLNFQ